MAEVHGHCDDAFASVQELLKGNLNNGEELGASIVVNIDGKNVVDIWGGHCDENHTRPWTENTITNLWSISKTVTNLAALVLVDRGLLDLDAKVAEYWPEFAANGKQAIEVRHILSHTSGVSGWDPPFTQKDMFDIPSATAQLAKQAPWWEPGTASGYHAQNQGHLVGELIRRVTGKGLGEFIAEDICRPLHSDFQLGAAESDLSRVSDIFPPKEPPNMDALKALGTDSPAFKTFMVPPANPAGANSPEWRGSELGALNGHGNARSVARILSAVSLGGDVDGERLLSPKTIDRIFEEQANGVDLVLGIPVRFGIGYGLPCTSVPYVQGNRTCFWGGWGGSIAVMDLDKRMTISYVMNKMSPGILGSARSEGYVRAIYDIVGEGQKSRM